MTTGAAAGRPGGWLRLVGRHQVASLVTTAIDFSVMVALVQLLGAPAALAAVAGAGVGAVVNFRLGRSWIFDARHEPVAGQALRYGVVSGASAALNGGGELLVHDVAGVHYVVARCLVAALVSLAWNLPMQRHFVFGAPAGEAARVGR